MRRPISAPRTVKELAVLKRMFLLVFFLPLFGCGADLDLGSVPRLYYEDFVYRPYRAQFYVTPSEHPSERLTAVILPFRVQQAMDGARHYGREITRVFYQTWLKHKVFPIFEYMEQTPFTGVDAALNAARSKGADLAVVGYVTQILAGGSVGASQLAIRVEIYEAASGAMLWSMAHFGQMKPEVTRDFLLFSAQARMPQDPMYAISTVIAYDTRNVGRWNRPARGPFLKETVYEDVEGEPEAEAAPSSKNRR